MALCRCPHAIEVSPRRVGFATSRLACVPVETSPLPGVCSVRISALSEVTINARGTPRRGATTTVARVRVPASRPARPALTPPYVVDVEVSGMPEERGR
jgi:hypothetical protein